MLDNVLRAGPAAFVLNVVAMGIGEIRKVTPETFPGASITVVLGSDYPVPTAAP